MNIYAVNMHNYAMRIGHTDFGGGRVFLHKNRKGIT